MIKSSKATSKTQKILFSLGMAACLGLSFPAIAQSNSAEVKVQVESQIGRINSLIAAKQLEQLPSQLRLASANYQKFTALGDVKSLDQNKWKVAQVLRQNLLMSHLGAAAALYDAGKFETALNILEDARKLEPKLPVTYYFEALNLLKQGKDWDATEKLYQAKRLNMYPAMRKIENPLQPWEVLTANPVELEARVDEILKSMGKDAEYPITLNFQTGEHDYLKLIPGVGANLRGRDGSTFNVYLSRDMINESLDKLGKPAEIVQRPMRDQMLTFNIWDQYFIIGMNPENIIERIQIDRPGYSVEIDSKLYHIGDTITELQTHLGENFGFEKLASSDPKFKETWVYNDFGLSLGITPDNKLGLISIWSLE